MNIIKYKKLIVMTLIFVMFMALVQQPLLTAKERRGATAEVTLINGYQISGELLAVKADALLIYDQDAKVGKSIDLQLVAKVKVLKKSKALLGLAIGLFAGAAAGAAMSVLIPHEHYNVGIHLYLPPKIGCLGGIIGFFLGARNSNIFSLAGESSKISQENLERLKRYAREQDVEKLSLD